MKVDRYLQHVPEIEKTIREMQPDAIVFGMGPTAWLLPWIDQRLLRGIELWGAHDGCRIMPATHLVIMDAPQRALNPDTTRYEEIVRSRPTRFHVFEMAWRHWKDHLPEPVHGIVDLVKFRVWSPNSHPSRIRPKLHGIHDGKPMPDTIAISPTGTTTLAWLHGRRRIGIIGADMMPGHHHTAQRLPQVDAFLSSIADQAHEAGGAIFNLSPITALKRFRSWTPPTSGSQATGGNETPEPSECSSTASDPTQPAP